MGSREGLCTTYVLRTELHSPNFRFDNVVLRTEYSVPLSWSIAYMGAYREIRSKDPQNIRKLRVISAYDAPSNLKHGRPHARSNVKDLFSSAFALCFHRSYGGQQSEILANCVVKISFRVSRATSPDRDDLPSVASLLSAVSVTATDSTPSEV